MNKPIFLSALLLFFSFISTDRAFAQNATFSEDFSGTLAKWQPLRDDGKFWSISEGSLQAFIPSSSTVSELIPTASAWKAVKNYSFEFDFTALQGVDKNVAFGLQDKNNWYELHFTSSLTEVVKVKNGTSIWSQVYPYVLPTGLQNHLLIVFINGRISASVNGLPIFDTVDPTYNNEIGTIGLKATTGSVFPTKIKIDNVSLKEIKDTPQTPDTILGVKLLKQADIQWANLEYDTATNWAKDLQAGTTIKDWGCNLLSIIMILQYHGITTFADNTPITPQSLNGWLLQHDGYYNSPLTGNINRKSVSQLTAEISALKDTPKLEFQYIGENVIETVIAEIEKGNPVILELDGHFVVADGFTADKKDLYIKDPAFDITKLSQHPLALKSARLYIPSHTDLSYISIASDEKTTISFTSSAATYTEKLLANNQTKKIVGPATKITEIAKPSSGDYELEIATDNPKKAALSLVTYQSNGTSQKVALPEIKAGTNTLVLHYFKDGASSVEMPQPASISYKDLRKTIKLMADSGQIKAEYVKNLLIDLLKPIELLNSKNQRKVLTVIRLIIESSPQSLITKAAKAILLDQVKQLMLHQI